MEIQAIDVDGRGAKKSEEILRVLRADGSADPELDPKLEPARVAELYGAMRRIRVAAERLSALGREERIGFVPSPANAEAAIVGATFALRDQDWIFPTGGDWGAALLRGWSLSSLVHHAFGDAEDALSGRDMPAGFSAAHLRVASASAPAATHLPHAVGFAWAARQRGEDRVTAAFFDGPEVDAADFHTGLNFAGVMQAPTVFLCRLRRGQPSAAEHAVAYGLSSARCDGSDLLAVVAAVRTAVERAAAGEGATVLDLSVGEPDDGLDHARAHLETLGAWDDEKEAALVKRTEEELAAAIDAADRAGLPSRRTLFDDVYQELPPHLMAQRDELAGR